MSKDKKTLSSSAKRRQARSQKLMEKLEQDPEKMAVAAAIVRRAQINRDLSSTNEDPKSTSEE